jgi:glycosyltransferase involved in cell wall biosynthesis
MHGPARQKNLVSVVIPAYREVDSLDQLLSELHAALDGMDAPFEIVMVDDGSGDGTAERLLEASRHDPRIRPVLIESRSGQSAALAAGLLRSGGEIIVTMDADLQNDPADIPRLLAELETADVVSGIRRDRHDTWIRLASSRIANGVRRAVLGDPVTDIGCSLKAYRREALEALPLFVGAHRFLPALCVLRGARYREVDVRHRPRAHGASKYGVANRMWRGLADLVGVAWLKARLVRYRVRQVD